MEHKILLIDDDATLRSSMKLFLEEEGFFVKAVPTGDEGVALIRQRLLSFSIALVDYHLSGEKGPEFIAKIRELDPNLHIIGFSGDDSIETHNESLDSGALMFVLKDTENSKLLSILHRICRDVDRRTKTLGVSAPNANQKMIASAGMIGVSDHLADIVKLILRCAPRKNPVLIRGENGTGKEKIAKAIHENSSTPRGPFIAVNCGAISRELIESELFGHEKGAFTGATAQKIGKFQAANSGTIFLDEIGEMPLSLQVALLRVLQENEITPVGSNITKKIDVRIVAATNAPLEKMISAGTFRQDLYYRLDAFPITLKPLRERVEDIPLLVAHFLKAANEANHENKQMLASCISALQRHSWPGNIRELGHAVQRMHMMEESAVITEETLRRAIHFSEEKSERSDISLLDYESWKHRQNEDERGIILRALTVSNNISDTAARLGIERSTLRSRLKALEIEFQFNNVSEKELA